MLQRRVEGILAIKAWLGNLPLRAKIAGANILLVVILSIALVLAFAWITRESEGQREASAAEQVDRTVPVTLGYLWGQPQEMQTLVSNVEASQDAPSASTASDLIVVDGTNKVIAQARQTWLGQNLTGTDGAQAQMVIEDGTVRNFTVQQSDGSIEYVLIMPVESNGVRVGALVAKHLVTPSTSAADRLTLAAGAVAILGCLLAALVALFVAGTITRPLAELNGAARDFAKGLSSRRVKVDAAVDGSDEVNRLATAFNQMADAVEARTKELGLALEAIRTVANSNDLNYALHELAGQLAQAIDVPICRISLLTNDGRDLVLRARYSATSPDSPGRLGVVFPVGQLFPAEIVLREGRVVEIAGLESEMLTLEEKTRWIATGVKAALGVPLMAQDTPIGILTLGELKPRQFTEDEKRLCLAVAQQAAAAIEKANLYQQTADDRERLDAIIRIASDGIVLLDGQRRVVSMNPAMEALSGWTTAEVKGRPCREVLLAHTEGGESVCETACPMLRAMVQGAAHSYSELMITTKDGQTRELSVSYAYVSLPAQGEGYGVAIARDITKAKEVERLKDEFASLLSHDLRQPVAVINGYAQVLRSRLQKQGAGHDILNGIEAIVASVKNLNQMIGDLVDSTRLESGRLSLNRLSVSPVSLAASAVRHQVALNEQSRVRVEADDGLPMISVDPERLERAVANLVGNALKYSPEDAEVLIRIAALNDEVVLSVVDHGVGIPAEDLPRVFDRLFRARTGLKVDGLGLGLYIARMLVEAHGGRLWVESEGEGRGSTFNLALPPAASEAEAVNPTILPKGWAGLYM